MTDRIDSSFARLPQPKLAPPQAPPETPEASLGSTLKHDASEVVAALESIVGPLGEMPLPAPPAVAGDPPIDPPGTNHPTPIPPDGNPNYYRERYDDFVKRHPNGPQPPDYYLDYGNRYIQAFTYMTNMHLSPAGMKWLAQARKNLQVAIEQKLATDPDIELHPAEFREFAFSTHSKAYLDAGLADLPLSDLIKIGTTPDLKDSLNAAGLSQLVQVVEALIPEKLAEYAKHPDALLKDGVGLITDAPELGYDIGKLWLNGAVEEGKALGGEVASAAESAFTGAVNAGKALGGDVASAAEGAVSGAVNEGGKLLSGAGSVLSDLNPF